MHPAFVSGGVKTPATAGLQCPDFARVAGPLLALGSDPWGITRFVGEDLRAAVQSLLGGRAVNDSVRV